MRFLADECCDFAAVRALRTHGHDVLAVSEVQPRSVDQDVMRLALAENRILLTEDKDFGWLVFAGRMDSPGVILIRFPARSRRLLAEAVLKLVTGHGSQLAGAFVVLQPEAAQSVSGLITRNDVCIADTGNRHCPTLYYYFNPLNGALHG